MPSKKNKVKGIKMPLGALNTEVVPVSPSMSKPSIWETNGRPQIVYEENDRVTKMSSSPTVPVSVPASVSQRRIIDGVKDPLKLKREQDQLERDKRRKEADDARNKRHKAKLKTLRNEEQKEKEAVAKKLQAQLKPGSTVSCAMVEPVVRRVIHFPGEQAKTRKPKNYSQNFYKKLHSFDREEDSLQEWYRNMILKHPEFLASKNPKVKSFIDVIRRHLQLIVDATLNRGPPITPEVYLQVAKELEDCDIGSINPLSNAELNRDYQETVNAFLCQIDLVMLETAINEKRVHPAILEFCIGYFDSQDSIATQLFCNKYCPWFHHMGDTKLTDEELAMIAGKAKLSEDELLYHRANIAALSMTRKVCSGANTPEEMGKQFMQFHGLISWVGNTAVNMEMRMDLKKEYQEGNLPDLEDDDYW